MFIGGIERAKAILPLCLLNLGKRYIYVTVQCVQFERLPNCEAKVSRWK
jgi:hypothetical protein